MSKIRDLALKLHNPFQPRWFDRSMYDFVSKQGLVLNLGSGNTVLDSEVVVNLDIYPFPNVDMVHDAHCLPFNDETFDCVFCNAVLEHCLRPWIVANEIQRVLKTGGVACIQVPFLEPVHDDSDYFRFTAKGLRSLFPELEEIKSGVSASSNQILADLVREFPVLVVEDSILEYPTKFVVGWLAKPIQHLDFLIKGQKSMHKYARANYFIGRKVEQEQKEKQK